MHTNIFVQIRHLIQHRINFSIASTVNKTSLCVLRNTNVIEQLCQLYVSQRFVWLCLNVRRLQLRLTENLSSITGTKMPNE